MISSLYSILSNNKRCDEISYEKKHEEWRMNIKGKRVISWLFSTSFSFRLFFSACEIVYLKEKRNSNENYVCVLKMNQKWNSIEVLEPFSSCNTHESLLLFCVLMLLPFGPGPIHIYAFSSFFRLFICRKKEKKWNAECWWWWWLI